MNACLKVMTMSYVWLYMLIPGIANAGLCKPFSSYVNAYYEAINDSSYLPQGKIDEIEKAYLVQICIVKSSSNKIIGFKAGLMSAQTRKKFQAQKPVFGVLLKNYMNAPLRVSSHKDGSFLFEAELGVKLKRDITHLDDTKLPLEEMIAAIAPAIEVANINFKNLQAVRDKDIVAANAGAAYVYTGNFVKIENVDLDKLQIVLNHTSSHVIHEYRLPDDYQERIRWLIRKAYVEGYSIETGMILLAGSISQPMMLEPGVYQVDFSGLGKRSLLVSE